MSKIGDALKRLESAGVTIERGVPATPSQIDALRNEIGCAFPDDYVAFLEELGWLRFGQRIVFGHGPGDGDIIGARDAVDEECGHWDVERLVVAPFLDYGGFPSPCYVFDVEGKVRNVYRGSFVSTPETSFEDKVLEHVELELEKHVKERGETALRRDVLQRLFAMVPRDLLVEPNAEPSSLTRLLLRRPSDGVEIEVRFGDGREYWYKTPGLFVFWTEPAPASLEAMNAYNRRARIARGAVQETRNRYRGRVPAEGLNVASFLNALANDTNLPSLVQPGSAVTTLEAIEAALPGQPLSPEEKLLQALLGKGEEPTSRRREGDELVVKALSVVLDGKTEHGEVRVRPVEDGFVLVRHTIATRAPHAELLELVNDLNGRAMKDGDVNFDMESFTRVTLEDAAVTFSFLTTLPAFENEAYSRDVDALSKAVYGSGLVEPPDAVAQHKRVVEEALGLPVGPAGEALLAFMAQGAGCRFVKPRKSIATPWGMVTPFLRVTESASSYPNQVDVGLVASSGTTSDDCKVIGFRGNEAVALAPDLESFLSVLALGTTGFAHDGDDEHVLRSHRASSEIQPWNFFRRRALCKGLGIVPAQSVTAILERAGTPRRAEVDRG